MKTETEISFPNENVCVAQRRHMQVVWISGYLIEAGPVMLMVLML